MVVVAVLRPCPYPPMVQARPSRDQRPDFRSRVSGQVSVVRSGQRV